MSTKQSSEITLVEYVRAVIGENDVSLIRSGNEASRVIVNFVSDYPDYNRLIKHYYVWITPDYAQINYKRELTVDVARNIALDVVKKRFIENGKEVPIEDGVSLSDSEEVLVDPKSYIHPLKNNYE